MKKLLAKISFVILALSGTAFAETWNGNTSSLWGTAANWTPSTVPNNTAVTFGATSNFNVDLGGVTRSVTTFQVNSSGYTVSNGTLEFTSMNLSANTTIAANVNMTGDRVLTWGAAGAVTISGNITGSGGLTYNAAGGGNVMNLTGDNSGYSGNISVTPAGRIAVGSNTALGTGTVTINSYANVGGISSTSTAARTISNSLVYVPMGSTVPAFGVLGDATNNGKLTFTGPITLNNYSGGDPSGYVAWRAMSDVEFAGDFSNAGAGSTPTLNIIGNNGTNVTFSKANNTYSGPISLTHPNYPNPPYHVNLRATANEALGTGSITIGSSNKLILVNSVTLSNNILSNTNTNSGLNSESGDNVLAGTTTVASGGTYQGITVTAGTLTINTLTGATTQFANKLGAGVLALGTVTNFGQFRVTDGVLRNLGTNVGAMFTYQSGGNPILEGNGDMTRSISTGSGANNVTWLGTPDTNTVASGGFAAKGGAFNVRLNNGTTTQAWRTGAGTSGFIGGDAALLLNSTTADNVVDFQNGLDLSAGTREVRVADNTSTAADKAKISGVISNGGLSKTGAGLLELTATNTYASGTTVSAGTLVLSGTGSINNSAVTVNGGTFSNSSSVAYTGALTFTNGAVGGTNMTGSLGGLTIGTNQTISPGNSPGTAATSSQTWAGGGTYLWEINDATGTAGTDPGWDLMTGTGALTITATSGSKFNINVTSLTLGNVGGNAANFNDATNYKWILADFTGDITTFDATAFALNTGAFTNTFVGTFGIARGDEVGVGGDASQIFLTYTVPEPSAMALVWGAAGFMVVRFLRRARSI